jgi:hypothetical protein
MQCFLTLNGFQTGQLEVAHPKITFLAVENERLRSVSPKLPSPYAPPPLTEANWYISQDTLQRFFDMPHLDLNDMEFILDKKEQFSEKQLVQTEQIVNTQIFRNWIVSSSSSRLLIQWDNQRPTIIADVSPLSVFCTNLAQALQAKERFMAVQWFCGRHIDPVEAGQYVGGRAMLMSLIHQLLRQRAFDTRRISQTLNLSRLHEGHLEEMMNLLGWLIRQLPKTITLFYLIDGVVFCERYEFCEESIPVLDLLYRLSTDMSIPATVKLLFTSTPGVHMIKSGFETEDLVINVDTLPRQMWSASNERMMRELSSLEDQI